MFTYDETTFNIDTFLINIKNKFSVDILYNRLNDIITYQNWFDKSMTYGTDYFNNYETLKYYEFKDYEKISYESIFEEFKNMYEWFSDDENYNILVSKLLNVFMGYDTYEEVKKYKEWKNIQSTKNNEPEKLPINLINDEEKKPIKKNTPKKIKTNSPKIEKVKNNIDILKEKLIFCINSENSNFEEAFDILKSIYENKNKNHDQNIITVRKIINENNYNEEDIRFLKVNLLKNIKNEFLKYLKYQYANSTKKNKDVVEFKDLDVFVNEYIDDFTKKCMKCSQSKLKYNFNTNKLKRDGYDNICKSCIK